MEQSGPSADRIVAFEKVKDAVGGDVVVGKAQALTLIDLVSQKHIQLLGYMRDRWVEAGEEPLSNSESLLLARINRARMSNTRVVLAEVARDARVSRQAVFKCAKKLQERGLICYDDSGHCRGYVLTAKGIGQCARSEELKKRIDEELVESLGADAVFVLKKLLAQTWV